MAAIELPACMTHPPLQSDSTPSRSPQPSIAAPAPAKPSTLERWFLHLLQTRPMAFWGGVWMSVFLVGVVALGSLLSPNAAERRSVSAVAVGSDSAVATQPLDTKGKVPVWLFGAIAITCTAGSILVSRQLNPAAVASRPLSRTTRRKLAKYRAATQAIAMPPLALAPAPTSPAIANPMPAVPQPGPVAPQHPPTPTTARAAKPKAAHAKPQKAKPQKAKKSQPSPAQAPAAKVPQKRRRWGQRSRPQVKRLQPYAPGELFSGGPGRPAALRPSTPWVDTVAAPTPPPPVGPEPGRSGPQPAMSFTLNAAKGRSPHPQAVQLAQPHPQPTQPVTVVPPEQVHPLDWEEGRLAELMDVRKTRSLQDW